MNTDFSSCPQGVSDWVKKAKAIKSIKMRHSKRGSLGIDPALASSSVWKKVTFFEGRQIWKASRSKGILSRVQIGVKVLAERKKALKRGRAT